MNNRRVENNEFFRKKTVREWDFVPLIKGLSDQLNEYYGALFHASKVWIVGLEAHYKHHTDLQRGYNWHCAKGKKKSQKHLILQDCFILFDRARSQLELLYRGEEASEKESRYGNSDKNNVYCFISFGSLRKKAFAFGVI